VVWSGRERIIPNLLDGVEWPGLLRLAARHQIVPLLNLVLQNAAGVPSTVQREVESYARTIVGHNLALASELIEILDALENHRIRAIPFKGPVWTQVLYGNLSLRQIVDLDLLLDRHEIASASKTLLEQGYLLEKPVGEGKKDLEFVNPKTGIRVELHWSACEISEDARLAKEKLWVPLTTAKFGQRSLPVPQPEKMLLLLALHGFRDKWQRLKWLVDIAQFVEVFRDLDWQQVLDEAASVSRRGLILLPLALVERLLGTVLPRQVSEALEDSPGVLRVAADIERGFSAATSESSEEAPGTVRERIDQEWMKVEVRDGFWERLGLRTVLLANLLRPNEKDRAIFESKLPAPTYWIVRPYRLLQKYRVLNFKGSDR
jgi:hypothetical protein